jgi:hypothetical protein
MSQTLQERWKEVAAQRGLTEAQINTGLHVMHAESSGNVNAKNTKSSATGLFQIIDGTWDDLVKAHPNELRSNGRGDPEQQMIAMTYLMKESQQSLKSVLGREPTSGEYYLAHFLGPCGAQKLLEAIKENPNQSVAQLMPDIIGPNANVHATFKDKDGKQVKKYMAQFSAADLAAWASIKMDEPVDYTSLDTEEAREEYRKKHSMQANPLGEAFGEMTPVQQMFLMCVLSVFANIFKGFGGQNSTHVDDGTTVTPPAVPASAPAAAPAAYKRNEAIQI